MSRLLRRVVRLFRRSGELPPGTGQISGILALSLAILAVLAVVAWHFPEYLTTPDLRRRYSVDRLRDLLFFALLLAGGLSLANVVLGRMRWLNGIALSLVLVAIALGGSRVPVGDFPEGTPYVGLDWLILDLLGSSLVFIAIEKALPIRRGQPVFRDDWQTDFTYFIVNHLLIGLVLLVVNFFAHDVFARASFTTLRDALAALPIFAEGFLAVFAADLVQYGVHRAYHEVPWLWRFHAVHHSAKTLDWMAGSRLHLFELLVTRALVLGALYAIGFSKAAIDVFIVVVGFQAVLNHANVALPWGRLELWIVTPRYHHWHHGSDRAAVDRNYAAHFSIIDTWFGTRVDADRLLPEAYGVGDDDVPRGFARQQWYPFARR